MKRVIFVGIHNKPNTTPLCSSTKSGKLIDRIIQRLHFKALKTNLFDVDYYPNRQVREKLKWDWVARIEPKRDDLIILLGKKVQLDFPDLIQCVVLRYAHPASVWSTKDMNRYVDVMAGNTNAFNGL